MFIDSVRLKKSLQRLIRDEDNPKTIIRKTANMTLKTAIEIVELEEKYSKKGK